MKWLLAIWFCTIIGLVGTYSHVTNLQESLEKKDKVIFNLQVENRELIEKDDTWYKDQVERWVPYKLSPDRGIRGLISDGKDAKNRKVNYLKGVQR